MHTPSHSQVLQYVWLEALTPKQCHKIFEKRIEEFKDIVKRNPLEDANNFICTWSAGKDTCSGDSGGPLIMQSGIKEKYFFLSFLIMTN